MGCGRSKVVEPTKRGKDIVIKKTIIRKPSKSFTEQYQFGNKIGTGGFAEVRRCIHRLSGTMRAVKIYNKSLFPPEYLTSGGLQKEIDILKKLDHPNLIKVFEYYEDEKSFYITMEFCLGGELFHKIGSISKSKEATVCDLMRQLFSVVAYIHSKGIVHRDLKPENVLIEERGEELHLKIADFGNAALIEAETKLKGETGTCYYMSPEVIQGEYTEKCDEWSCGIIMYMLLFGKAPFDGETDEKIIENVKIGNYNITGDEFDNVSNDAKDLISKLLVKENHRISASEALVHKWFGINKKKATVRHDTLSSISKNLKAFRVGFRLKEAMKSFIMSQILTPKEYKQIRDVFAVIDSDGDGIINKNDLIEHFRQTSSKIPDIEAEDVLGRVDIENKGFLEYSEFLKASIDDNVILSEKNLTLAFNMMDTGKKGFISPEDFMIALSDEATEEDVQGWKEIVKEAFGSGLISLNDFIKILSS